MLRNRMRAARLAFIAGALLMAAGWLPGCKTGAPKSLPPEVCVPSIWPVTHPKRQVTSPFGYRSSSGSGGGRFHAGLDIAAPKKSAVVVTAPGVVTYTGRDRGGYGKIVKVDHGNGYESWYAHLARIKTKRGKKVKRGQLIGKLGKTGRASGPHLHYEVRKDGKPVNPASFLP